MFLLGLIIPILSFFLQSYPRFFNKYFGVDVWTRLLEIEHVKKSNHKIPGKISKGFIIEGYFDYPIIFPWIFSFFSKKRLLSIQGFVSPFFDILQNFFVFCLTYYISNNLYLALSAQFIYTLTPILAIENSYMTPRSLGYFNFTLAFMPLVLYQLNDHFIYIVISIFFATTLFLTHRFALQSFVFISIFFSIYNFSYVYIFVLIMSCLLAVSLSHGYYLRVLKGHLYNIYFWVKNYEYRFSHQIYGNKKQNNIDWVARIYSLMSLLSPILLFSLNIWSFSSFLYLILTKFELIPVNEIIYLFCVWIIFFYILGAVILKVKSLIPIGEGQRYMEMATVPSAIVSAYIFIHLFQRFGMMIFIIFITLLLGNLILILFVQTKGIINDKNRSLTEELKNMYGFINSIAGRPRIICIPHQITTMTVYNTKSDVLVNADNPGLMKLEGFYPILKKSLSQLTKEYNLDYLLLRESFVSLKSLDLDRKNIVHSTGDIVLVKLKR